jgi:hypothetical protein
VRHRQYRKKGPVSAKGEKAAIAAYCNLMPTQVEEVEHLVHRSTGIGDMLVMLGGRERNLEEYKALFSAAGLRFSSVTPTSTQFVLLEAVAA